MSYVEVYQRCLIDSTFFLALLVWVSFFTGGAFYLGVLFVRCLVSRVKNSKKYN